MLKPGGTCIFVQRIAGSGIAGLVRLTAREGAPVGRHGLAAAAAADACTGPWVCPASCAACPTKLRPSTLRADASTLDALTEDEGWDLVQWGVAVGGLDPHAVGVAIKPLQVRHRRHA